MHRSPFVKPHAQAKKVPPPAIPGDPLVASPTSASSVYQQLPLYRLGGSISAATGKQLVDNGHTMSSLISSPSLEEGGFNLPREPTVALRIKDEISEYSAVMSASSGSAGSAAASGAIAPGVSVTPGKAAQQAAAAANPLLAPHCPLPVFCTTQPLTHKAAVYYHQQLALQEDQGIDLTQSPGRDSPGSSSGSAGSGSRHSTASLDSGRASSYLTGASSIRSSTGCPGGGGALSSPRCSSLSSCSIGSVDRQRNDELIIDWLMEMKYEEYAQLFIAAGYDLPTIARMTPEDLTAIGIKNPHHRERIKQRIDKLQVLDNLPHFVPGSIEEWLQLLRLEEYIQPLLEQNYKTVRDVTQVTWEDLEDIGIVKLGHQKKILLAIKRVKDITSGKWNPGGTNAYQQEYRKAISQLPTYVPTARVSWDDSRIYASAVAATPLVTCMPPPPLPVEPLAAATNNNNLPDTTYYCTGSNHECCNGNDMVLIKVRQPRGKSLESLEDIHDNSTRSHLTFSHYTTTDYGHFAHPTQMQQHQQAMQQQLLMQQQQQQQAGNRLLGQPTAMTWRRSYDDGDITPTNDVAATRELMYEEGGGTLPRQQQRGILQRAVLNSMPPLHDHHYMNAAAAAEYVALSGGGASVPGGGVAVVPPNSSSVVLDNSSLTAPYLTGSPMASKKVAPEPPRRHCSIRNSRTMSTDGPVAAGTQQQVLLQHGATPSVYYNAGQGANMHLHGGPAGGGTYAAQQQQPIYANYATIQQTTAEIHCEKFHDNKSTSSIDSIDTIPFANENTGTIKQRLLNRQECSLQQQQQTATHHQHSSSSSSSSSSSANTIAALTHSFHSLKTSASLHDGSLIRSDSIGSNTSGGSVGPTAGLLHLRSPSLQYPPSACSSSDVTTITTTVEMHTPSSSSAIAADATECPSNVAEVAGGVATTGVVVGPQGSNSKVTANVLNDIGNMLANLTDELDAMLEEEKRVGLNIDSE